MAISVMPTGAALGARIEGVDLTQAARRRDFRSEVRRAFYEYEVVYFRGDRAERRGPHPIQRALRRAAAA